MFWTSHMAIGFSNDVLHATIPWTWNLIQKNWILNMNICNLIDDGGHNAKVESRTISMKKNANFMFDSWWVKTTIILWMKRFLKFYYWCCWILAQKLLDISFSHPSLSLWYFCCERLFHYISWLLMDGLLMSWKT